VRVTGVGRDSMQGDVAFLDVLAQAGAVTRSGPDWLETEGGTLRGIDVDLNAIPDAAMTLGVVALFAQGPTRIRGVANWRVKETDRIAAMATELRKLGATVEEHADGITVTPPKALRPAQIATYDDHRIAMCFSLAAIGGTEVVIEDPTCVKKTYPAYFTDFIQLFDQASGAPKV
jgi:3-phosphoshikimate 1-carboxyvinyltransferase